MQLYLSQLYYLLSLLAHYFASSTSMKYHVMSLIYIQAKFVRLEPNGNILKIIIQIINESFIMCIFDKNIIGVHLCKSLTYIV